MFERDEERINSTQQIRILDFERPMRLLLVIYIENAQVHSGSAPICTLPHTFTITPTTNRKACKWFVWCRPLGIVESKFCAFGIPSALIAHKDSM